MRRSLLPDLRAAAVRTRARAMIRPAGPLGVDFPHHGEGVFELGRALGREGVLRRQKLDRDGDGPQLPREGELEDRAAFVAIELLDGSLDVREGTVDDAGLLVLLE